MAPQITQKMMILPGAMFCFFLVTFWCQPVQTELPLNFKHVLDVGDPSAFKAFEGLKMLYYFVDIRKYKTRFFCIVRICCYLNQFF